MKVLPVTRVASGLYDAGLSETAPRGFVTTTQP